MLLQQSHHHQICQKEIKESGVFLALAVLGLFSNILLYSTIVMMCFAYEILNYSTLERAGLML